MAHFLLRLLPEKTSSAQRLYASSTCQTHRFREVFVFAKLFDVLISRNDFGAHCRSYLGSPALILSTFWMPGVCQKSGGTGKPKGTQSQTHYAWEVILRVISALKENMPPPAEPRCRPKPRSYSGQSRTTGTFRRRPRPEPEPDQDRPRETNGERETKTAMSTETLHMLVAQWRMGSALPGATLQLGQCLSWGEFERQGSVAIPPALQAGVFASCSSEASLPSPILGSFFVGPRRILREL